MYDAKQQLGLPRLDSRRHTLATVRGLDVKLLGLSVSSLDSVEQPPPVPLKSPGRTYGSLHGQRQHERIPIARSATAGSQALRRLPSVTTTSQQDVVLEESLQTKLGETALLVELPITFSNTLDALEDEMSILESPIQSLSRASTLTGEQSSLKSKGTSRSSSPSRTKSSRSQNLKYNPSIKSQNQTPTRNFAKVWQYSNSRLPKYLPTLKVHTGAWPFLTLAALYSERVYGKIGFQAGEDHVIPSSSPNARPAVLRSVVIDDVDVIVFSMRGTKGVLDWKVNLGHTPASPREFLDDPGNLCHYGFLQAAQSMVKTVAARLKALLESRQSRTAPVLLFTGHSAGGAAAQLLYAHMHSDIVQSELTVLKSFFQHIHCITFGVPPVSLRPLRKPAGPAYRDSLFISFINEGDPVVRADAAVLKSLFRLYMSPVPQSKPRPVATKEAAPSWIWQCWGRRKVSTTEIVDLDEKLEEPVPKWSMPPSALSLAGMIVLLRSKHDEDCSPDSIEACEVSNEILQSHVFGAPSQHSMNVYLQRTQQLAQEAITNQWLAPSRF